MSIKTLKLILCSSSALGYTLEKLKSALDIVLVYTFYFSSLCGNYYPTVIDFEIDRQLHL